MISSIRFQEARRNAQSTNNYERHVSKQELAMSFDGRASWIQRPAVHEAATPAIELALAIDVVCETQRQSNGQRQKAGQVARVLVVALQP